MPSFSPWNEHQDVRNGHCTNCGIPVPSEALIVKDGTAKTYSHRYTDGTPCFSPNPKGRTAPCLKSMGKLR